MPNPRDDDSASRKRLFEGFESSSSLSRFSPRAAPSFRVVFNLSSIPASDAVLLQSRFE